MAPVTLAGNTLFGRDELKRLQSLAVELHVSRRKQRCQTNSLTGTVGQRCTSLWREAQTVRMLTVFYLRAPVHPTGLAERARLVSFEAVQVAQRPASDTASIWNITPALHGFLTIYSVTFCT